MSKNRKNNEILELKAQIKDLQAIIKSMERQLSKKDSAPKRDKIKSSNYDAEDESICKQCNNGKVKETDLGKRLMISCTYCDYRKVIVNA